MPHVASSASPRSTIDRRRLQLALAAAAILGPGARSAAFAQPAPALSADDQALVDKASAYLNGLGQMQGRFEQTDSKGAKSTGAFYLNRPNRARLDYDPPSRLLIVCDGAEVLIYDRRLDSFENYPLSATPLSLFLADPVRFSQDAVVESVDRAAGAFTITVRDDRHRPQGRIILTFSEDPIQLLQWSLVDAKGQKTTVAVTEFHPVSGLDPGLFVLRNPHLPPPPM